MSEVKKDDVIEIPVGRYVKTFRQNPWILTSIVLAIAVVILAAMSFGGSSVESVSEDAAAQNVLDFINAQGTGSASIVSSEKEGGLYNVVVNFNGEDIPVFVTLDGKYLITDRIPLDNNGLPGTGAGTTASNEPVDVEIGDSPTKGNADAPVTIVEFSDYECPFCGRFYTDVYQQLNDEYIETGKVKLVFKDFPLSFHPNAQKAAEAARCVRDQKGDEGYWKMHDLLFENQQTLSEANFKKWARTLGVNGATFDNCLESGKYEEAVNAEVVYGSTLGVGGTPTSFVNGVMVEGAQPYSAFKQVIDAELAKVQ